MKNIVITNVYGYKNIGDGAILDSAIKIINKIVPEKKIHIHAVTKFSTKISNEDTKVHLHPYGIAIKTAKKPITDVTKVVRFMTVVSLSLFYSLLGKIFPNILPEKGDYAYIKSLKEADIVFGIGGGYLRTKNKYKDYFGLLLTLLPICIAHLYNKRVLYLPMSYGNFASSTHEKIVFHLIKNDSIIFRDEISMREFHKYSDKNKKLDTYLIPDLALFDEYKKVLKSKKDYIVLTARLWMSSLKQQTYEHELALFIEYVWQNYRLKTIFLPMVRNEIEDDDTKVGKRIGDLLKNKNIFTIYTVNTAIQVKRILAKATIAICTRMHSAILSTIVKTPFITIAYEYKTVGFLQHLGLEKWNIYIEDVSFPLLRKKFDDLFNNNYTQFQVTLAEQHTEIMEKERELIKIMRTFRSVH